MNRVWRATPGAAALSILGLAALASLHVQIGGAPSVLAQIALLLGAVPRDFPEAAFLYSAAPRATMAILAGAALGLAGMALQQATGNRLASPYTLGASSGAWLALVIASIVAPQIAGGAREGIAFAGAAAATALTLFIAGREGIGGLPLVLAGMAVSILLGATATGAALLNAQYVRNIFVWGAGDLAQTGWQNAASLAPRLGLGALALVACLRPLSLMALGAQGARARGLAAGPFLAVAAGVSMFLTAAAVATVGLIGFVGLAAPNMARALGVRRPGARMAMSAALGAAVLLVADMLALIADRLTADLVPTGACAALIGAPVLIVLMRRPMGRADHAAFRLPQGRARIGAWGWRALVGLLAVALVTSICVARTRTGWDAGLPRDFAFALRWPRALAAGAAGAAMAVSGVLLQRLVRNPLASPDILGISAGAALALVGGAALMGVSALAAGPGLALLGAFGALALLLALNRRHGFAPGTLALTGVALAALMDSGVNLVLARGDEGSVALLAWLSGSTWRATPELALSLAIPAAVLGGGAIMLHRWATALSGGDAFARGVGLAPGPARLALLSLAAALAAAVTATLGPIAFVGLLAPHLATMAGARRVRAQIAAAALAGAILMVAADWLGRVALYPAELPAGLLASVLGGAYFIAMLARRRRA